MVNATVDNEPVSIQLSTGQSTTVPSNEVWKVQLTVSPQPNSSNGHMEVNGVSVISTNSSNFASIAPNTTLQGGDKVKLANTDGGSIQGFVVDS